jgi:hypothetical protein
LDKRVKTLRPGDSAVNKILSPVECLFR